MFSGVAHGFAVRGDPNIPDQRASLFVFISPGGWFWRLTGDLGQGGQRKRVRVGSRSGSSDFRRDA